jgi:hypothetical protein
LQKGPFLFHFLIEYPFYIRIINTQSYNILWHQYCDNMRQCATMCDNFNLKPINKVRSSHGCFSFSSIFFIWIRNEGIFKKLRTQIHCFAQGIQHLRPWFFKNSIIPNSNTKNEMKIVKKMSFFTSFFGKIPTLYYIYACIS